jgi:hypothetical protein
VRARLRRRDVRSVQVAIENWKRGYSILERPEMPSKKPIA